MNEPDRKDKDTGRPSLSWMQKHGKWLGGAAVVGSLLFYVIQQVNPDSVMEFMVNQAIEQTKTQVYRCLNNQMWSGVIDRAGILKCSE